MTTPERYARVKQLFLAACERTPEERARFIEEACGGDHELYRGVEALLSHLEEDSPSLSSGDLGGCPQAEADRFQAGDVFAERYRIVSRLGRGGMGEVYRADDLTLGVPVSLKFLRVEGVPHREALLNEVRMARRVSHPGVCRVFDVGEEESQTFVTMEYIEGEDLASELRRIGRLPAAKVLELARELCAGLAAAHDRGVLHRDLKPANVMVDADGHARIVDFGIAIREGVPDRAPIGTPAYMAPEQLVPGGTTTEQTDLYALGLLLYEAVAGRPLFRAESIAERRALQRSAVLEPLSASVAEIDPRLEQIILQALQDDPQERPASARAMGRALEERAQAAKLSGRRRLRPPSASLASLLVIVAGAIWLSWPAPLGLLDEARPSARPINSPLPDKPSIIVLPFDNLSGDPEQEHFADGLTEDLTTALSRTRDLLVLSRHTAFTYKGHAVNPQDLRAELGVRYVVEGSVRREGDRIRVNAQLIDARTGAHAWAAQYEREMREVFEVQSEIVASVSSRLNVELLEAELRTVRHRGTKDLSAYETLLRGRSHYRKNTRSDFLEARRLFKAALERDPEYADAHARLAATYTAKPLWGEMPNEDDLLQLEQHATEALRLDPTNPYAHAAMGGLQLYRGRHATALQTHRKVIALAPSFEYSYLMAGVLEVGLGHLDKAEQTFRELSQLNPRFRHPVALSGQGLLLFLRGDLAEAREQWEQARRADPGFMIARAWLVLLHVEQNRRDEAREIAKEITRHRPDTSAAEIMQVLRLYHPSAEDPDQMLANLRQAGLP